jgi:hypothetical protein
VVGDRPDAVQLPDLESGAGDQIQHGLVVEVGGGVAAAGLLEVPGQRLGQHRRRALRDQQTQQAIAAQDRSHGGQGERHRVDDLEHPVTHHHVDGAAHQLGEVARVTLTGEDPSVQTGLGRPTLE